MPQSSYLLGKWQNEPIWRKCMKPTYRAILGASVAISVSFCATQTFAAGVELTKTIESLSSNIQEAETNICRDMQKYSHEDVLLIIDRLFEFATRNPGFGVNASFPKCLKRGLTKPAPLQRLKVGLLLVPWQDDAEQYEWFQQSAAEGNLDALFRSASVGLRVKAISTDSWRKTILEAADKGHKSAQKEAADRFLGFYREGMPPDIWPKDGYQAIYWYTRFASNSSVTHSCGAHRQLFRETCDERFELSQLKIILGAIHNRDDLLMAKDVRAAQAWWESAYDDGGNQRAIAGELLFGLHLQGQLRNTLPARLSEYERYHAESMKRLIQH